MHIDLHREIPKVTTDSERQHQPAETLERAKEALARLGLDLALESSSFGDFFWLSWLRCDPTPWLPAWAKSLRIGGKGPSRDQSHASCAMELVERLSLYRHLEHKPGRQRVWDLRAERWLEMEDGPELNDTRCTAAGNAYEDALLHALQELVETRSAGATPWAPVRLVHLHELPTLYPRWVQEGFAVLSLPTARPELHHVLALRSPDNRRFDPDHPRRMVAAGGHLLTSGWRPPRNHHSPNSGSAAGLCPDACAQRAIGEALQADPTLPEASRRDPPPRIAHASPAVLTSHATDSITGDIRRMLSLLGDEVFVGVIDVTDPLLGVPVVKLISDYDPGRSYASRAVMELFFELDGRSPLVNQA